MCGIAGYLCKSGTVGNTSDGVRMLELQRHRGPDDAGMRSFSLRQRQSRAHVPYVPEVVSGDAQGVVGFNRLSIVDLTMNGHQPMCGAEDQVILAFNGEIYNASDFREDLEASGFSFRGHSDTEVILNLYLKYGFEGMIEKLNGMFAIVLIDLRSQSLYLCRDRFGIKPLYIFESAHRVAFSSEIKSFTALQEFTPVLQHELLDEYLLFRNTINRTLFKGVENLGPGSYRVYNAQGECREHVFHDVESLRRSPRPVELGASVESLQEELRTSVKRQLISDVKVGCQLSGGIDSSLVTLFAQEQQQDKLETISITFEDAEFSEEPYIETVTGSLSVKSHRFRLDAGYYAGAFDKATWHFEAPLNHPNTIGIYLLSEKARDYVTVLLSGEGSDEVFGGYGRFAQVSRPWTIRNFGALVKRGEWSLQHAWLSLSADYRSIMSSAFMSPAMAARLHPEFCLHRAMDYRREIFAGLSGDRFDKQVKYELKTYLPDLLMRQDKMSMAHSIENRVPFLDNALVDASFNIPSAYLLGDGSPRQTKWLLKRLAARQWGDPFAFRNKGGFSVPVRSFFGDKQFSAYAMDKLLPGIARRGWFNGELVQKWMTNLSSISTAELEALWIMIAFEAWAAKYEVS